MRKYKLPVYRWTIQQECNKLLIVYKEQIPLHLPQDETENDHTQIVNQGVAWVKCDESWVWRSTLTGGTEPDN
jgi:hypothetical protein